MEYKIVDDSQWSEIEIDIHGDEFGTQEFYTFDELSESVDEEYRNMDEYEKDVRMMHGTPTYLEWVYGYCNNVLKKGQKIEIDEFNNRHRIVELNYEPLKNIVVEPEIKGFHDRGNRVPFILSDSFIGDNNDGVEIIRGLMFFYAGQKEVTLGKVREFFTDKSIELFEHDGFIKINKNEG